MQKDDRNRQWRERGIWLHGQGEPIIFVHGIGSTHEVWAGVIDRLQGDFLCISYDLRGHGASPSDAGRLEFEVLVDDLEQVRQALGLARAAFAGHSLGAIIAAAYALKYPERVTALCLLAAPANRKAPDRLASAALLDNLMTRGVASTLSTWVASWYTESFIADHPDMLQERLAQLDAIDDRVFIKTYELYSRIDIDTWLPGINAPALVMTGEFARGSGADVAGFIARGLTRSSLVVVPGLKNGILTEVPGQVAGEIRQFLTGAARG